MTRYGDYRIGPGHNGLGWIISRGKLSAGLLVVLAAWVIPSVSATADTTPTSTAAATPALPNPVANFAPLPPIRDIQLSPDGLKAVLLQPVDDTYHVAVSDLETGTSKLIMAADPEEFLFNWCRFANSKRIICSIRSYLVRQSAAAGLSNISAYRGGRIVATRLLAINADGSNQIQLVKQKRTRVGGQLEWIDQTQDNIVSWLPDEPNHILIALTREDRQFPAVYRLNINNNRLKEVQSFRAGIYAWGADRRGRVSHGFGRNEAEKLRVIYLENGVATPLDLSHLAGAETPTLLGYTGNGASAYLLANAGGDTRKVFQVDSKTGKIQQEYPSAPDLDAQDVLYDANKGHVMATIELGEHYRYRWVDAEMAKHYQAVKAQLPGNPSDVLIKSISEQGSRMVLSAWGNQLHPAHYLYDRNKKALTRLATAYASVPAALVNKKIGVSYPARDGLDIPAYLTLPANRSHKNLPTIILPHGGPYLRDDSRFDYWPQFLASRGYAVLQPNYRGSSGYGDTYLSKGFKQWGLAMQDDLDDGLAWMIEQGYTDANRVCMVGGSYGGYAALVAAFKSADKYQCAVSFAGVADLDALVDRWALAFNLTSAAQRIQSGALRDRNSPIKQVKEIGIPLLIVHGDVDERVPVSHSRALVAALKKRNKAHTYIELANGDHHLSLRSHRETFLTALDQFLAEHIGPNTNLGGNLQGGAN